MTDEEFCDDPEELVFPTVEAVAVNSHGDAVVIRQNDMTGAEPTIIIPKMHVDALILAIQEAKDGKR